MRFPGSVNFGAVVNYSLSYVLKPGADSTTIVKLFEDIDRNDINGSNGSGSYDRPVLVCLT